MELPRQVREALAGRSEAAQGSVRHIDIGTARHVVSDDGRERAARNRSTDREVRPCERNELLGQPPSRATTSEQKQSLNWAFVVGLARIELATSALSVLRSNRLSYSPRGRLRLHHACRGLIPVARLGRATIGRRTTDWPWPRAPPLLTTRRPLLGRIHRSRHGDGCRRAPTRFA